MKLNINIIFIMLILLSLTGCTAIRLANEIDYREEKIAMMKEIEKELQEKSAALSNRKYMLENNLYDIKLLENEANKRFEEITEFNNKIKIDSHKKRAIKTTIDRKIAELKSAILKPQVNHADINRQLKINKAQMQKTLIEYEEILRLQEELLSLP